MVHHLHHGEHQHEAVMVTVLLILMLIILWMGCLYDHLRNQLACILCIVHAQLPTLMIFFKKKTLCGFSFHLVFIVNDWPDIGDCSWMITFIRWTIVSHGYLGHLITVVFNRVVRVILLQWRVDSRWWCKIVPYGGGCGGCGCGSGGSCGGGGGRGWASVGVGESFEGAAGW